MPLLAIPNISEGRDLDLVGALASQVSLAGARVLDVHSDPVHNRSVITATGTSEQIVGAMSKLARAAAASIDLTLHQGVHPRLGALDVCPVVPHHAAIEEAVVVAHAVGNSIGQEARLPVFFYGAAATREDLRELSSIRTGGLRKLAERVRSGLTPDRGPDLVDERRGVVCVGARRELIAFNVWLQSEVSVARAIASSVRTAGGGPEGIQALGLAIDDAPTSQVSMNLTRPSTTGIDRAFAAVEDAAHQLGARIVASEIVGLLPEAFLPDPNAKAARLLVVPGRSVESALRR